MRNQDLIPCFMGLLEEVNPTKAKSLGWEYRKLLNYYNGERVKPYTEVELDELEDAASWLLDTLSNELDDHVPAYCYFGAHPGDGSDYGVWVADMCVEDAVHDGTLIRVEDLSELDVMAGFIPARVLVVNDHGNMTLYAQHATLSDSENGQILKIECKEVWGIV
jgi:hypothetical protein